MSFVCELPGELPYAVCSGRVSQCCHIEFGSTCLLWELPWVEVDPPWLNKVESESKLVHPVTTVQSMLGISRVEIDPGGGHSHWKGVWGCAAVMTPFFQASCRSLAHQFTVNVPLSCPLFSIFRKFLHFQPCFGQNSSSLDQIFSTFSFPRPHFLRKIRSLDPTFWNPRGTHPPKKSWVPPPPREIDTSRLFKISWDIFCNGRGISIWWGSLGSGC